MSSKNDHAEFYGIITSYLCQFVDKQKYPSDETKSVIFCSLRNESILVNIFDVFQWTAFPKETTITSKRFWAHANCEGDSQNNNYYYQKTVIVKNDNNEPSPSNQFHRFYAA